MPNTLDDRSRKLIFYLYSILEVMRRDNTPTWELLVRTVSGKSAVVGLDDVFLLLSAEGGKDLRVHIERIEKISNPAFYTSGQVLRDVISGRYLLDKAINEGYIYVRGNIDDLLQMYYLVINTLTDANMNQAYLRLWLDFEETWKGGPATDHCWKLEEQLPEFGKGPAG